MIGEQHKRLEEFLATMKLAGWPMALTCRLREFGVGVVFERPIGPCHWSLIVDDRHVESAKQAVYDCVPITYRMDVVGLSASDAVEANR
jgi:hypothetical protein